MLDLILGAHIASYHPEYKSEMATQCNVVRTKEWAVHGYDEWEKQCREVSLTQKPSNSSVGLYARDVASGFGGGFYRNSERRWSAHFDWTWEAHRHVDFAFGAVTGYSRSNVLPFVVPSVKFPLTPLRELLELKNPVDVKLSYVRNVGGGSDAVHLSIETRFKP